jgi:hypothetical protein
MFTPAQKPLGLASNTFTPQCYRSEQVGVYPDRFHRLVSGASTGAVS